MMQKPKFSPLIMVVVLMVAVTGPLFGHVSFNPSTAQAGVQHMLFYIRAPVEKDIPMVELGQCSSAVLVRTVPPRPLTRRGGG